MTSIRKNKPKDCQYHIVRVLDCVEWPRNYKIKNVARFNYQLVVPFYGRYIINWMKSFSTVTEQGFRNWIEVMKAWDEKLSTLDDIQNKAAELQLALKKKLNVLNCLLSQQKIWKIVFYLMKLCVKLNEQKKNRPADIVLELKFMGVSLSALIRLVSSTKINEKEFKEWVKKNENDEDDPLPINEFVSEKYAELTKISIDCH
uniref:Uncharacterized protein n=1 Tax=Meloidogyne enterolobii TaxID=390850 RepID=A0A6V7W9D8_MELEN|nr:unnamed protein product [Meloidogyne enterolobii]